MRMFTLKSFKVWQRNADVFIRLWHSEAPGFIIEPILILFAIGIGLGSYVGLVDGQRYIEFVAPGVLAGYAMFSAVFECTYGSFIRMDYQKTFDAIIATPLSIEDVTAGEIFWGATRAMLTGTLMLVIATLFGLIHSWWALLVIPLAFIEGVLFASISLLFSSLVPHIYSFNYFISLFVTPMFYFSGVFFPLSSFPAIVQNLSWIAPLTPVVTLMRAAVNGSFELWMLLPLGLILLLICIFFSITLVTMRRRLSR